MIAGKGLGIEERLEFASLGEGCCLGEDVAVMELVFAGQQGMKGEDAGVGCAAEGERGEGVGAPSEAAQRMAGVALDGGEGNVEGGSADGVVNDIEALACGVFSAVLLDRGGAVVDWCRAVVLDDFLLVGGDGGEDSCAIG